MIAIKNKSKTVLMRVISDGFGLKFGTCYMCGQSLENSDTTLMHRSCWDRSSLVMQNQAEADLDYAELMGLTVVPKGAGKVELYEEDTDMEYDGSEDDSPWYDPENYSSTVYTA